MSYRGGGQTGGFTDALGPQVAETFSLIDRHSSVEGTFSTDRDLRIEGEMRGTVRCQGLLYVAEGADVDATVEASNITVAGRLRGNVTCRGKLQLMPTGRMHATVVTDSLVINEGAIYEGELHMDGGMSGLVSSSQGTEAEEGAPPILRRFSQESGDIPGAAPSQAAKRTSEE